MKKDWRGILELYFQKTPILYNSIIRKNLFNLFILLPITWIEVLMILIKYNSIFYKTTLNEITAYEGELKKINKYNYKNKNKKQPALVLYNFYSHFFQKRLLIVVQSTTKKSIKTVSNFFFNAGWLERETSEMYGITFKKQWDSRNLLLEYSFNENPMLKEFPVTGYEEIKYNHEVNWIVRQKTTIQI